ncbi:L-erythro-3,5-diaminohexanoate dehydrogenase [Saccharothrix tamanrassetensis]|uniref:L-erythro-3,5-diaminohexanoate dehydrogenase n=1 Tax=Saccharothrix tamanrassetensis TaxID=1051531 RepID=A0A841CKS4_9PSEU|nr:L-erythro-3,5-diaminohexanoate dehydrogenase [Saccharothrix tamanrassetensis]MBB5957899.1 L-erythro-3,5-diaminohexanoate dehydrogenase [Saccharothrix tamanrassetensis]
MTSPYGLHRVLEPAGVLPQQAWRLDATPECGADEVVVDVERLNLDAASFRQLREEHGPSIRQAVLDVVAERGKMQNPVTGSGGMLLGTVRAVGPSSPLGLEVGDRVATLVSLTLTPLRVTDGLARWDGTTEQVPCTGTAVLFGRSIAAVLPCDLPDELALSVLDVCGAPALTNRVVRRRAAESVLVLGGGGKSGSLSLAAARRAGASRLVALVPTEAEASRVGSSGLADEIVVADARDPVAVLEAVGTRVDVTVVCVDVPGCEHGAILATADGGTVVFFSMATSFSAAALGAEGLAADVEMIVGNGYVPGHAAFALDLLRTEPAVRALFEHRQTAQA